MHVLKCINDLYNVNKVQMYYIQKVETQYVILYYTYQKKKIYIYIPTKTTPRQLRDNYFVSFFSPKGLNKELASYCHGSPIDKPAWHQGQKSLQILKMYMWLMVQDRVLGDGYIGILILKKRVYILYIYINIY